MFFDWIKAIISAVRKQYHEDKQNENKIIKAEKGVHRNTSTFSNSQFEGDYITACNIMKKQIDRHFPDNYHARLRTDYNPLRDYSAAHSAAIDESSAAVAQALRAGAGVDRAVKSGLQTIGL